MRTHLGKVLAILTSAEERDRLRATVEGEPWQIEFCGSVAQAKTTLPSGAAFAAVVLDRDLPGVRWEDAVRELSRCAPGARIILASAAGGDTLWQRVVEHGGHDLLTKPLRTEEVRRAILHAHWYSTTTRGALPLS